MTKQKKFGLKLFATNTALAPIARELVVQKFFDYIELYTPPDTYTENVAAWRDPAVAYLVHGPHMSHGVNLSDSTLQDYNRTALSDAQKYADALNATGIIVHGGSGGTAAEVARQLAAQGDARFLIENTPVMGLNGQKTAVYTPDQVAMVRDAAGIGSVLDIGHAIYAANSLKVDHFDLLREFICQKPAYYHLSDGDMSSEMDVHKHIGEGNFDLSKILSILPASARITVETPKDLALELADARHDVQQLRQMNTTVNE
jgi:Sugar phosphate isomerases/epimerases